MNRASIFLWLAGSGCAGERAPADLASVGGEGDSKAHAAWSPGDDIPGWEDADCDDAVPGQVLETRFPSLFRFEGEFFEGSAMPWSGPHRLEVSLRDCVRSTCSPGDRGLDRTEPFVLASLDGTLGDGGAPRALGLWGPDGTSPRAVHGSGNGPLEAWSGDGSHGTTGSVTVCLSRVRPDEVAGKVRVEIAAAASDWTIYTFSGLYSSVIYSYPFDIHFADHSGVDASLPPRIADQPLGWSRAHWIYDEPYDTAWPWDDITDPAVRHAVYKRYSPYNTVP